jgi:mono/diheme cytochrome c family protein
MKQRKEKSNRVGVTLSILTFVITGMLSMSFICNAQSDKKRKPWAVPEKEKAVKSPVKSDAATLANGKTLFTQYCKSCHGSTGKGDGPKSKELDTPTGDFTEKAFQAESEGEIFYKAKEGRDDMPGFKKKIVDEKEIWAIVVYVRSLAGSK